MRGAVFFFFSFFISLLCNLVILKFFNHEKFLDLHFKNHAVHSRPVPRIGGLGIYMSSAPFMIYSGQFLLFILSTIVFLIGFIEDLRKGISPLTRLISLLFVSILTYFLLGLDIKTVGFIEIPPIFSFLLIVIAITGYTNAVNIVDGLNGLASGISFIFLLFLGVAYYEFNDNNLFMLCFVIDTAILAFLIFNFPFGYIFLGDGGAYFLGYICAVLSLLLVNKYPEISPWFPLILGIYPVWEVLFSAYRRRRKGRHPFSPDKLHFHTLLYYRGTRSNPKASFIILLFCFVFSGLAFLLRTCTYCLVIELFVFLIFYFLFYKRLLPKFKKRSKSL